MRSSMQLSTFDCYCVCVYAWIHHRVCITVNQCVCALLPICAYVYHCLYMCVCIIVYMCGLLRVKPIPSVCSSGQSRVQAAVSVKKFPQHVRVPGREEKGVDSGDDTGVGGRLFAGVHGRVCVGVCAGVHKGVQTIGVR